MYFFLLCLSLFASPLKEGDTLWKHPTYHKAIERWKEAKKSHEEAISIMAQYRLLLVSSNIMFPIDLIRADQELSRCDVVDPRCLLARVDREIIFHTLGYTSDHEFLIELLGYIEKDLPTETAIRMEWIRTFQTTSDPPTQKEQHEEMSTTSFGPTTRGPGAPAFSIGFFYGVRQGLGTHLRYYLPNVDRKLGDLSLYLSAGTTDYGRFGFQYNRIQPFWIKTTADIRNVNYFRFVEDDWEIVSISSTQGSLSLGYKNEHVHFWIGPQFRWEQLEQPIAAHGLTMGMQLGSDNLRFSQSVETTLTSYSHIRSTSTFQYKHHTGLAFQLRADLCPKTEAPWWRYPSAGGGLHLRLPLPQRLRAPNLYTGVVEMHLFPKSTLGAVLFTEGAYGENIAFGAAGIGARIRVPPSANNNLRLDVGYGTLGWGIYADVGEQF